MAMIHMTLQGKGGVGKSLVASLIAQHVIKQGKPPICIDTDPVNATFAGYKRYNATRLRLGEADEISPRAFDQLIETIVSTDDEDVVVIDNGAATFLPLLGYMVGNEVLPLLRSMGHEVRLHSVLTGGQAFNDTIKGLEQLFTYFDDTPVVVWLNEYFGDVAMDGVSFEGSGLYKKNQDKIHALIRIEQVRKETFGVDIEQMLRTRLTFDEAINNPDYSIMHRQRLLQTWRGLSSAMEQAQL